MTITTESTVQKPTAYRAGTVVRSRVNGGIFLITGETTADMSDARLDRKYDAVVLLVPNTVYGHPGMRTQVWHERMQLTWESTSTYAAAIAHAAVESAARAQVVDERLTRAIGDANRAEVGFERWKESATEIAHLYADNNSLCSLFDDAMDEIGLPRRSQDYYVDLEVTMTVSVRVTAQDEDSVSDHIEESEVDDAIRDHIRTNSVEWQVVDVTTAD